MEFEFRREDEEGNTLAICGLRHEVFDKIPDGSVCLAYIDSYGDTVFNELQIVKLIEEIKQAQEALGKPKLDRRIDEAIAFLEETLKEPHQYIRFVGD